MNVPHHISFPQTTYCNGFILFMVAMNMCFALCTLEHYSFRRTIYIGATHEHAKITTLIKLS